MKLLTPEIVNTFWKNICCTWSNNFYIILICKWAEFLAQFLNIPSHIPTCHQTFLNRVEWIRVVFLLVLLPNTPIIDIASLNFVVNLRIIANWAIAIWQLCRLRFCIDIVIKMLSLIQLTNFLLIKILWAKLSLSLVISLVLILLLIYHLKMALI